MRSRTIVWVMLMPTMAPGRLLSSCSSWISLGLGSTMLCLGWSSFHPVHAGSGMLWPAFEKVSTYDATYSARCLSLSSFSTFSFSFDISFFPLSWYTFSRFSDVMILLFSQGTVTQRLIFRMMVANITTKFIISRENLVFCGTLKRPWSV